MPFSDSSDDSSDGEDHVALATCTASTINSHNSSSTDNTESNTTSGGSASSPSKSAKTSSSLSPAKRIECDSPKIKARGSYNKSDSFRYFCSFILTRMTFSTNKKITLIIEINIMSCNLSSRTHFNDSFIIHQLVLLFVCHLLKLIAMIMIYFINPNDILFDFLLLILFFSYHFLRVLFCFAYVFILIHSPTPTPTSSSSPSHPKIETRNTC